MLKSTIFGDIGFSRAGPSPSLRLDPSPYTFVDPPLLTAEGVARMTTFWIRFMQLPDSIKATARRTLVREVLVPVGKEHISTLMVDMSALAAQFPSVAAVFEAVQLTPQQHDAYRAAALGVLIYESTLLSHPYNAEYSLGYQLEVNPVSALGRNLGFLNSHRDEFARLEATGMWVTP